MNEYKALGACFGVLLVAVFVFVFVFVMVYGLVAL